jgi:hypothetical protein
MYEGGPTFVTLGGGDPAHAIRGPQRSVCLIPSVAGTDSPPAHTGRLGRLIRANSWRPPAGGQKHNGKIVRLSSEEGF